MARPFTTTLLIPTLNEIEGMKVIMPQIRREWVDQILIMDGNSTDGTIEYARENGYEVLLQQKRGIRYAYIEALPHIRGEVLLTFSPDGNSVPELIPLLLDKMEEGYDMVIASRYLAGAKSEDDGMLTGFGNWLFTKTVNVLFGGHYTDAMVIYRAYWTRLLRELEMDQDRWYTTPERLVFHADRLRTHAVGPGGQAKAQDRRNPGRRAGANRRRGQAANVPLGRIVLLPVLERLPALEVTGRGKTLNAL